MCEGQKKLADDAIDITDMFEPGAPRLVMARRFLTQNGYSARKSYSVLVLSSFLCLGVNK